MSEQHPSCSVLGDMHKYHFFTAQTSNPSFFVPPDLAGSPWQGAPKPCTPSPQPDRERAGEEMIIGFSFF